MSERDDRLVAGALNLPPGAGAVLGIIFAGGASRRFGQDKISAGLGGIPLLQLAAQQKWPLVASVSGDTPFIPRDMVARLAAALQDHDCVVASREGVLHP